jgi:DNA-binding NtrC family response regulator
MNKSLILIIDDEPSYLTLLRGLLQDEGYKNVITEENPLNIERILNNFNVELIITDIYMPQMNGLELLEKVNNSHPQIPIIVITGVEIQKLHFRLLNSAPMNSSQNRRTPDGFFSQ